MPLRLDVKRKLLARSDRVKCVDLHPTEPWLLAALYNGNVHIWNYDNQQLVKSFEVCDLPVRAAKFIPRKSWVVTGSDDMHIRIFNYNTLERVHQFEAHSDYLRSIVVHPTQSFVITASDDMMIKLWDWDNKWQMKQTFEGHTHYVMQVAINPKDNNTFATASLDKTVKVWQFGSQQPNFTLEGHEKGVSMDQSGKILWARHSEIQQANLKTLDAEAFEAIQDGERLPLSVKDLGACEIYPQTLAHSSNGRFVVACGDGEYIVYTAMALRNKDFGQALEFVWATDPNMFAVRESATAVKIKKNFKEYKQLRTDTVMEGIDGGPLLAARSASSLCFYDWETAQLVRRIEIAAKHVYWSDSGEMVAICGEESFYVLKYNSEVFTNASAEEITEDGVEDTFEVIGEQAEGVKTAFWIGDCFVFTTSLN
ncbi:hypothetical protein GCK32_012569, partial [Trichostrongylus colubriformis]